MLPRGCMTGTRDDLSGFYTELKVSAHTDTVLYDLKAYKSGIHPNQYKRSVESAGALAGACGKAYSSDGENFRASVSKVQNCAYIIRGER